MAKKENNTIDFKGIIQKLLSYWMFFLVSVSICYIAARVYLHYTTATYRAATTILIKDDTKSLGLEESSLFNENKKVGNELALIKSYDLVEKTINQLDFDVSYYHKGDIKDVELYHKNPFTVLLDSGAHHHGPIYIDFKSPTTFQLRIGEKNVINEIYAVNTPIHSNGLNFTIVCDSLNQHRPVNYNVYFIIHKHEQLVQQYTNYMGIARAGKEAPGIVELSIMGTVPEKLVAFLNTHIQTYL